MTGAYQLAFVPAACNREFNEGAGLSIEYRLLECIEFRSRFRRLDLTFSFCRITLTGDDLRPLFDQIRSHGVDRIDQAEPGDDSPGGVSGMTFSYY
jgi:hypothetical protein